MSRRFATATVTLALAALSQVPATVAARSPDDTRRRSLVRLPAAASVLAPRATGCAGGLVYDDGTFESRYNLAGAEAADMVMRFDLPAAPATLEQVCLCFSRTGGDDALTFDLLVFAADGPGGEPGTFLTGIGGLTATGIPIATQGAFYDLDLAVLGIELDRQAVFIGASWNATAEDDVFFCGDDGGPGPTVGRPAYGSTDLGATWTDLATFFPALEALGIRAEVGAGSPPEPCVADAETLCLNDGRFAVTLDWQTPRAAGPGQAVPLTPDTGYFYFENDANVEAVVKVIEGCVVNERYWVFAGGLTNVRTVLTVTDTARGESKTYVNPQGTPFEPIQDTGAFATCP